MFCSPDCYASSLRRHHRYECPIMSQLLKSGSVHMALRLFFIALSTFDGSIEQLKFFFKENENKKLTIFDFDLSLEQNEKNLLQAFLSLVKSSKVFSLQRHEDILKIHPELKTVWENHNAFIRSLLQRQCQISDLNFHGIYSGSSRKDAVRNPTTTFDNLQHSIGSSSLLFCSLVNHSCSNNILRICFEGKVICVVCRPIAKGNQLFDCYK